MQLGKKYVFHRAKRIGKSLNQKKSIALNVLYIPQNREKVRHAYISKYNSTRENKVILLMITDGENGIILPQKICLHSLKE